MKELDSWSYGIKDKDDEVNYFFKSKRSLKDRFIESMYTGVSGKIALGLFAIILIPVVLLKKIIRKL